jgi:ABC-type spermidine/putrescine transport system permease subunit I
MNIQALLLSIRLALCVSSILFVVGLPLAYWLTYHDGDGSFCWKRL